uniref:Geminin coiled-coil domain containing n=1 Tax=Latimeria chalumnae TaxID=7897 RepID=H3BAE3_LATCH
ILQSTILSCQDQYYVGGQGYDCPYSVQTSAASVDVSKETWVSLRALGILDNTANQPEPGIQASKNGTNKDLVQHDGWTDQLSSQLYRNRQLQDTLLQKEEELARLHEENIKLRQYLNPSFVKRLEETTMKLLSQSGQKIDDIFKHRRKRLQDENIYTASQGFSESYPKKVRRNLSKELAACEEQPKACIDTWVLQTLGLKDVDTIDDTSSANYSAISSDHVTPLDDYHQSPDEVMSYTSDHVLLCEYSGDQLSPVNYTASSCNPDLNCLQQLPSPQHSSAPLSSSALSSPYGSPYCASDVIPNKTEVAFSTSLNPHRNVKTHTFRQGQAFVRRDEEGGWKFTWVPKQN